MKLAANYYLQTSIRCSGPEQSSKPDRFLGENLLWRIAFSRALPRDKRDITVPMGIPQAAAVSL